MKPILPILLSILSVLTPNCASSQVSLERKGDIKTTVMAVNNQVADRALKIASLLLNSIEFKDSLAKLKFSPRNFCPGYSVDGAKENIITGNYIFSKIHERKKVLLALIVDEFGKKPIYRKPPKENSCYGLGVTLVGKDSTTSHYENINCDMNDLPFTAAYAVHLCHEYVHNIGFCHTTNEVDSDVAEAIGWIAYHYIKKWNTIGELKYRTALNL